jgi:hypothetical protein
MEPHGTSWNVLEDDGMSWNILEHHGTPWNLIEGSCGSVGNGYHIRVKSWRIPAAPLHYGAVKTLANHSSPIPNSFSILRILRDPARTLRSTLPRLRSRIQN